LKVWKSNKKLHQRRETDKSNTKDAYVTRVREDGFNAIVPRFGYEGWVPIDPLKHGTVVFDSENKVELEQQERD